MEDVLKDIKSAEEKAKKTVEDAEKKRLEMVSRANHDSMKLLNEKKVEIDRMKDRLIEKKTADLDDARGSILDKGRQEAAAIGEKARKNIIKAEDFVLKRFEEEMKS